MAKKAMVGELVFPLGLATVLLIGCALLEDSHAVEDLKRVSLSIEPMEKRDRPAVIKFLNFL